METKIPASLDAVQAWVEANNYRGYDPGDGLTSYLRLFTGGNLFAERLLQQLVWKAPFNLRPWIGVQPLESTKGRGFMAAGYLRRCGMTGDFQHRIKAEACLAWLDAAREPDEVGHC